MSKERTLYTILNSIQECDTISDLANKLYLSQPYISRTIKNVEKEYDTIIIHRNTTPIKLTHAGEVVLNNLRKIIETQNELKYELLPYQKTQDYQIKIALNQPFLETNSNQLLIFLIKEFPNITFSFYERTTNLAQEELLNHNIDIFIGKFLTNQGIISKYITEAPLVLVIPDSSPAYQIQEDTLKSNSLKILDNLPFISLTDDSFFQAMVDNLYNEHEIKLNKLIKVENSLAAIKLAVQGYGVTIAMRNTAEEIAVSNHAHVKLLNIPSNLLELNIGISYLKGANKLNQNITQKLIAYFTKNCFFAHNKKQIL